MRRIYAALLATCVVLAPVCAQPSSTFDEGSNRWDLSNGILHATFQISADGKFTLRQIDDLDGGHQWTVPLGMASSPVRIQLGAFTYDANTTFQLVEQHTESPTPSTTRQVITLQDLLSTARVRVELEISTGQPVLRHRVGITNLTSDAVYATTGDLLPYRLDASSNALTLFRVTQWVVAERQNFHTIETALGPDVPPVVAVTGAHGDYCAWIAVRDADGRGLFAGWEFDGQAQAGAQVGSNGSLELAAAIKSLHHRVEPGATFTLPAGFLGMFQGSWDQAGYATQRFSEAILAKPAPDNFPYVSWDSWAYQTGLNEQILRLNADAAASLGVELFVVDLGWAKSIGDWHEDPAKFPGGLRALSNYVHSQGMKFGLHFALAEVALDAPVLQDHPDWTASESDNYFGAASLCLSNQPARDWLIGEAVRMIDEYGVDYLLQDGENMVKQCSRTNHTHDPADSNYSNSVDGINAVIAEVQRQRPNTVWENCENGGNMMTFQMVQQYVTSITNDASGALGSRQGVWGATYPFTPRFADRYMPEDPSNTYITRSYMFGGPWHFMNQLASMDAGSAAVAQSEIGAFKSARGLIRDGEVFHLTGEPGQTPVDAIESYSVKYDKAVVVVTREGGQDSFPAIRLQGLYGQNSYLVHFQDDPRVLTFSGLQLTRDGVRVNLPYAQSAEIVYVEPLK